MSRPYKVEWTIKAFSPDKASLIRGIEQWTRKQTKIYNLRVENLERLNVDDLELMALGMGYKPSDERMAFIVKRWQRKAADVVIDEPAPVAEAAPEVVS